MNLKINHIQHIGIPVTDIKKSEAFYEKLGFTNVMASTFEIEAEKGGIVAMMKRETMIIELYQMPESKLSEIKSRKDGHVDHIAFDVDDIDLTFTILKENEVEELRLLYPDKNKISSYLNRRLELSVENFKHLANHFKVLLVVLLDFKVRLVYLVLKAKI